MVTEKISNILIDLTNLLNDGIHPHAVSFAFEKIAISLNKENLRIETTDCKEYYEDAELALILLMKNEALSNGQFDQASKFLLIEKELRDEKGNNQYTQLKTEPFLFEFRNNRIIFHCNKRKENQRLIANLIEGHNLFRTKTHFQNLIPANFF
ncbi:MAG: hypothetical protein WKI04_05230 [Ferruginibacter sp.]